MEPSGKRLIAMVRCSTERQSEAFGPQVQEQFINAWCAQVGHTIVDRVYEAVSGTVPIDQRDGFTRVLAALDDHTADGVVCLDWTRFSRSFIEQERGLQMIWERGGDLFLVDNGFGGGRVLPNDPDDPDRRFIRGLMGLLAERDRDVSTSRMRKGLRQKAAQGGYTGGIERYGFRRVLDENGVYRNEINNAEQEVIARMRARRAEGASVNVIADELNRDGVPTKFGKAWQPVTVSRVLKRDPLVAALQRSG